MTKELTSQEKFDKAVEEYNTKFICLICFKPYTKDDRLAAIGECKCYGWDKETGEIDEVEPVNSGWEICHYSCLYKENN